MAEASSTAPENRRAFARLLPLVVPVVLLVAAVTGFVTAQRSVDDQEERLLRERTSEVVLVLNNAVASIPAGLQPLGVAARLGDDPEQAFLAEARATSRGNPNAGFALV